MNYALYCIIQISKLIDFDINNKEENLRTKTNFLCYFIATVEKTELTTDGIRQERLPRLPIHKANHKSFAGIWFLF